MTSQIDISIVIVNYNVKDFLSQCIKSIQKSDTKLNYEIIVIDNNSNDGSKELFESLSAQLDNLQYHYLKENIGFGRANNIGFEKADGKYTLILNPDTLIEVDTLQVMYDFMEANQDVGASGCKVLNYDGTFQVACRRGFPTPWASFCKLFGLQKLFPQSKLFSQYNLSYLDENQVNDIDSLIGAFMFTRTDVLKKVDGFDSSFFMYGEDLDLCYRIKQEGLRISYYPKTKIIHFKGESAKRSSINEDKHFYEAMEIFAKKHYGRSKLFFTLLKSGIKLRAGIHYVKKHKIDFVFIITDLLIVNASLLISTKLRRGDMFAFPDYAYPTVFIFLSLVTFISMIFSGEYFENNHRIRKSFFGLVASLIILTFLTYFFRSFAFSRGILLMTITLSIFLVTVARFIYNSIERKRGVSSIKRIVFVGWNKRASELIKNIKEKYKNSELIGYISNHKQENNELEYLGEPDYIHKTINDKSINEVIVLDKDELKLNAKNNYIRLKDDSLVHIYVADEYDSFLFSKLISNLSGTAPELKYNKLLLIRYKLTKRFSDILISIIMLTLGLPLLIIKGKTKLFLKLLFGKLTFVGLFPLKDEIRQNGKIGIIGLAHISEPEKLNDNFIKDLNNYYLENYSLALDFDILFKYLFNR